MARRVVCFSGPDGAFVGEIASGVAERLGFALVDEEIVLQAATRAGLEPADVADVERRRSFMERALQGLASGADASSMALGGASPAALDARPGEELRNLIREAIEETADRGDVVIASHAASHALASRPGTLRVLVTASPSTRRLRLAEERGLDEKEAARALDRADAARADYLKRFYGARRELPTQYDFVVNTDRLSADEAVELVVLTARR
jgi:cytidylate kinase